jgi:hypothetical protein
MVKSSCVLLVELISHPYWTVMEVLGGRATRLALLIASLLGGLVIALLTVHLAGNWQ